MISPHAASSKRHQMRRGETLFAQNALGRHRWLKILIWYVANRFAAFNFKAGKKICFILVVNMFIAVEIKHSILHI